MKLRILLAIALAALACGLLAACESAHEHDYVNGVITQEATCTEDGVITFTCSCGKTKDERIPAAHDYGEWQELRPATCTDDGAEIQLCKNDANHYNIREIAATGHESSDWIAESTATCSLEGYEFKMCLNCFAVLDFRTVPATGHTFGEWQIAIAPSCAYTGKEESKCENCGAAEYRALTAIDHVYANGVCTVCGRRDWSVADIHDPDLYNSEYGLRALGKEQNGANLQTLYLMIDNDARAYHNGEGSTQILGMYNYAELNLTFNEVIAVWKTYMDDHPLYYWMGRDMYYGDDDVQITVDKAYTDPALRIEYNQAIYNTADRWRREAAENAYLAALAYHDKIVFSVDYAYMYDGRTPQTAIWAHNIIGVFTEQGAVCEGYARSFQLMLNMTGIENRFVSGTSQGVAHAWNLVRLDDGEWYWFDLTYDDAPGWMWGVQYNYFAVNDSQNINHFDGDIGYRNPVSFSELHSPDNGVGIEYLAPLPERGEAAYKGMGETLLRQTFTVGEFTYAVVGYKTVQLVECTASGEVFIPEYVEFEGTNYEVISVGEINGLGMSTVNGNVFTSRQLTTIHIPKTVRFLWETSRQTVLGGSSLKAYCVDEDNQYFASVDGVLFTKNLYTLIHYPDNSPHTQFTVPDQTGVIANGAFVRAFNLKKLIIGSGLYAAGYLNWGYGWLPNYNKMTGEWRSIIDSLINLEEIVISEDNKRLTFEDGMLFNYDKTCLYVAAFVKSEMVLPETVNVIDTYALSSDNLKRLIIQGDSLKVIKDRVFCYYLEEIVFGGTREQWDAIEKDADWDVHIGRETPQKTYALTCLGDL